MPGHPARIEPGHPARIEPGFRAESYRSEKFSVESYRSEKFSVEDSLFYMYIEINISNRRAAAMVFGAYSGAGTKKPPPPRELSVVCRKCESTEVYAFQPRGSEVILMCAKCGDRITHINGVVAQMTVKGI